VKARRKGKWVYLEREAINRATIERMSPYSIIELKFDFPTCFPDGEGRGYVAPFYPLPYPSAQGSIPFPAKRARAL
jgi:hypothetical protein